jgi:mRNA interferase MazF
MSFVSQGDIISIEGQKFDTLVLSKDFFNKEGFAVLCPIAKHANDIPLHIQIVSENYKGIALLENLKSLNLNTRFYKIKGHISFDQIQNISDAVQGIFEYAPWGMD